MQATWIAPYHRRTHGGRGQYRRLHARRDARERVVANLTVAAHNHLFSIIERPWLTKDFVRNSHLADVMKKSDASENTQILERNVSTLGNGNGIGDDALRMAKGFHVFKVKSGLRSIQRFYFPVRSRCTSQALYGGTAIHLFVLARSLFLFCESLHALLKRRAVHLAVHLVWIHDIPSGDMTGFVPHRAQCFVFGRVPFWVENDDKSIWRF